MSFKSKQSHNKGNFARKVTIVGSFFWIFFGVWGVNSSFEAAKEARRIQIRDIELAHGYYGMPSQVQPVNWVVPTTVEERIYSRVKESGLDKTPYYFEDRLLRHLLTFAACMIMSIFVLYATIVDNRKPNSTMSETPTS